MHRHDELHNSFRTVYNYCSSPANLKKNQETQLGGADLYGRLRDYLKKHIRGIYKVRNGNQIE